MKYDLTALILSGGFGILLLTIGFMVIFSDSLEIQSRQKCNEIDSCDKYSCLAEKTDTISRETNYLLKYQLCKSEGYNEFKKIWGDED